MRALVVIALSGCSWVYGLDETSVRGPDLDGDDIVDGDVCPTVFDPLQKDSDGDTVGDECDPCELGTQTYEDVDHDGVDDGCDVCTRGPGDHDEDGDGITDHCDNCPALSAPQTNDDGDDLGNACDPFPTTAQTRRTFAGMELLPDGWFASVIEWKTTNDAVYPVSDPGGSAIDGLWNRNYAVTPGTTWVYEAAVDVPAAPPMNLVIGIALRPRGAFAAVTVCQLTFTGVEWYLIASSSVMVNVGAIARLRLVGGPNGSTVCSLDGDAAMTPGASTSMFPQTPVLFTTHVTTFRYIDFLGAD